MKRQSKCYTNKTKQKIKKSKEQKGRKRKKYGQRVDTIKITRIKLNYNLIDESTAVI